jgi:hypothetical protein
MRASGREEALLRGRGKRQHRAWRFPYDLLGHASKDQMREAVAAVRLHHDKVSVHVFGGLDYRGGDFGRPRD